jgi:hypothetical protein
MVWEAALLIDALTPLHAAQNGLGEKPYLGWSSWSLQATKYPGYGGQAWLTAQHVNAGQVQERATQLQAKSLPPLPPLPALPSLPGQTRWCALLNQAQWALQTVSQEMEEYAAARSESWQEGERGEAFQERLEAVQEVLATVEELTAIPEKTPPKPLTEDLSCLVRRQCHILKSPPLPKRVAESSHAAASDRENDKNNGHREYQQYERGCDDGNLSTCLLPSWNAKKQAYKCGDK